MGEEKNKGNVKNVKREEQENVKKRVKNNMTAG